MPPATTRVDDPSEPLSPTDDRRRSIHNAAIEMFSEQGYTATSMADIAASAGMSRPALYQYFENKGDIFRSAFVALFEHCVDRSLASLHDSDDVEQQLDGCLQRFEGDLYERMAATSFTAEIMQAKSVHAVEALPPVLERLRCGLAEWLEAVVPGNSVQVVARRASILDLVRLSPHGFKVDQPTVEVYRSRLSALARTIAADLPNL